MYIKKFLNLGRRKGGVTAAVRNGSHDASQERRSTAAPHGTGDQQPLVELAEQNLATKILTVQDGDHSVALVDYAVKMAQKLDCEIIALDVSDKPLDYTDERRSREINRFQQRARRNAETLSLKAETIGVKCKHLVEIGNEEEIIKALSREDPGIRYVLFKPAQDYVSAERRKTRVPVVDLNCSSF